MSNKRIKRSLSVASKLRTKSKTVTNTKEKKPKTKTKTISNKRINRGVNVRSKLKPQSKAVTNANVKKQKTKTKTRINLDRPKKTKTARQKTQNSFKCLKQTSQPKADTQEKSFGNKFSKIVDVLKVPAFILAIKKLDNITSYTKKIHDLFSANEISKFMDAFARGPYHRVYGGHEFFSNVGPVYKLFGIGGVIKFPAELSKDFMTPHGIPYLPGTDSLVKHSLVLPSTATKWLSFNIAHFAIDALAITTTINLYHKANHQQLSAMNICGSIALSLSKILGGFHIGSPVLILDGMADIVILAKHHEQVRATFKKEFTKKNFKKYYSKILKIFELIRNKISHAARKVIELINKFMDQLRVSFKLKPCPTF